MSEQSPGRKKRPEFDMEKYVDTYRDPYLSVFISSPAGSGKTEKLARRYIALLEAGSEVRKVLCITFTEKAAAEMKERILSVLRKDHPELHKEVLPQAPLMRISTFHAFCLKLLKRFSLELGLDPSLEVMDEVRAKDLWSQAVHEALMQERDKPGPFFDELKSHGLRGWDTLRAHLDRLNRKSPLPEMMQARRQKESEAVESPETDPGLRLLALYGLCHKQYQELKSRHHTLDYADLEVLALRALSEVEGAYDLLYSFDEHTDHILVDEFQDTNTVQWMILDRLTEEWRSGLGAKADKGLVPTLFLVGDEKQSIYLFRGANVTLFREVPRKLSEWMGNEFLQTEATENYRSLPKIVTFTNELFGRIMRGSEVDLRLTRYIPFRATRQGTGRVEFLGYAPPAESNMQMLRRQEADLIARRILGLKVGFEVTEKDGSRRRCKFEDMAILLRKRTHLGIYEEALRASGIPFIVVKGIGFYAEYETSLLRDLVCLLVDPLDNSALFNILRSPLMGLGYKELRALAKRSKDNTPMLIRMLESAEPRLSEAAQKLLRWASEAPARGLAQCLEEILIETSGWARFSEPQRAANVRKFLSIIEEMESKGLSLVEVREKLLRQRDSIETPKANISNKDMQAVSIMTVHASKGLQFPVVFLPAMDEDISPRSEPVVFDETGQEISMGYEEQSELRKEKEIFRNHASRQQEEEKRSFYVAVTRAMDCLVMSGALQKQKNKGYSRLDLMEEAFGSFSPDSTGFPFEVLRSEDLPPLPGPRQRDSEGSPQRSPVAGAFHPAPLVHTPEKLWVDVTSELSLDKAHGEHAMLLGNVMHKLLEDLSLGILDPGEVQERARALLRGHAEEALLASTVARDIEGMLGQSQLREIVLPAPEGYVELPFVLDRGSRVYKGRMDRVIIREGVAHVYDYKTYQVSEYERPQVARRYAFQMQMYKEAASRLFGLEARAWLVLTKDCLLIET